MTLDSPEPGRIGVKVMSLPDLEQSLQQRHHYLGGRNWIRKSVCNSLFLLCQIPEPQKTNDLLPVAAAAATVSQSVSTTLDHH